MGFTFLTLALISFSADLLRILYDKISSQTDSQKSMDGIEHHKIAIISSAIATYSGMDPNQLIIRNISDETPRNSKRENKMRSPPKSQESKDSVRGTITPWTLTGREDLMQTRKLRQQ